MRINDKIANRIFMLMNAKYPCIIDIDYRYLTFRDGSGLHFFTFYYDIDKIHSLFPNATVNHEYLRHNEDGVNLPIEGFHDNFRIYGGELYRYGTDIYKLGEVLIKSVKNSDEHYQIRFKQPY